jgi:hypothetical protein
MFEKIDKKPQIINEKPAAKKNILAKDSMQEVETKLTTKKKVV